MRQPERDGWEAILSDLAWRIESARESIEASRIAGVHDRALYHCGCLKALKVARDAVTAQVADTDPNDVYEPTPKGATE